ncbi:polysaccharide deacetylase family protein [Marivirga arenosa]|uniref:Polysaccharide deacetylase family protein n=1 Tax=Marivirga arenosa TaxID=3059076 RepID=A0AA51N658_9BACT|nr:polysaccharide deacetylase family protein [Marivirga sp. ABR2-2]WMN06689.1 polysaccharide deacetylase family protein [Marivirga sp. ABR2-2]
MSDFAFYKTPKIIQNIFPSFQWKVNTDHKIIFPTFDDGPIPNLTNEILAILKDFNAKATFFCVGDNIRKHPQIFEQLIQANHQVGNHTFNHLKAWKSDLNVYLENVELCQKEIEKHIKPEVKLFRPPYGQFTFKSVQKLKQKYYNFIMWDVLSKDYNRNISANTILKKSIQNSSNGSIIVFHDNLKSKDKILQFLPLYLKHFSDIGYKFEKL